MEKYSKILIPSIYLGIIAVMVVSTLLVVTGVSTYLKEKQVYTYTLDNVFEDNIIPVAKTESDFIIKPFLDDSVKVGKGFYDFESNVDEQVNSIIYYENTYIQNNGVDYVSSEDFDVVSILDGEIISIEDNEVYGKVITIEHGDNLKTVYSNVTDILATVGYKVSQGEIIALSTKSKLSNDESMLHFEVYYKGDAIDPENLYTLSVSDFE